MAAYKVSSHYAPSMGKKGGTKAYIGKWFCFVFCLLVLLLLMLFDPDGLVLGHETEVQTLSDE